MNTLPACPKCNSKYTYKDGLFFICSECANEWDERTTNDSENYNNVKVIKDANGNILQDGDSVVLIKDLRVKGSSSTLKVGTKVKSIRLVQGDHDIRPLA